MRLSTVAAAFVCLLIASPVAAEFYKYRDSSGAIHFTDNLAEVPPDQRPKAEAYQSYEKPEPAPEPEAAPPPGDKSPEEQALEAERRRVDEKVKGLRERQAALVEEFEALNKEREQLKALMGKPLPEDQVKKYQQQIQDLNRRADAYHQRRKAYEKDVQAHNAEMAAKAPEDQGDQGSLEKDGASGTQ